MPLASAEELKFARAEFEATERQPRSAYEWHTAERRINPVLPLDQSPHRFPACRPFKHFSFSS